MKNKRILCLLLIAVLLGAVFPSAALAASEPEIAAAAVLLADRETGEILWEKNADEPRAPASLTKIMTVLLAVEAVERGDVSTDEAVTAGPDCLQGLDENSSSAGIRPGETMPFLDLLYCAMLSSANESCNIIAERLSGSVDAFAARMNERALALGCTGTHFVNPNGLSAAGHVSTARDLYLIGREAMAHPLFAEICATSEYEAAATNMSDSRWLENSNALLNGASMYGADYVYEGCAGLKTGYTGEAGYCLVSAVERRGLSLMAVVLGCDGVNNGGEGYGNFSESIKLYDWAFSVYESRQILSAGQIVRSVSLPHAKPDPVPLYPAEDLYMRVSTETEAEPLYSYSVESELSPPVEAGTVMGTVTVTLGTQSRTVDMVCREEVQRRSVLANPLFWAAAVLMLIIAFVTVFEVKTKKRKKAAPAGRH